MKRQNGAFFDQEAWEREREEEHERAMAEGGGKKRKLTKAEVVSPFDASVGLTDSADEI